MHATGMSTRERRRRGYCLTCRTARRAVLHAFWTTVCMHSTAARPWGAHERHLCLACGLQLLLRRDPRVRLQFGRRLRIRVPITNVRIVFRSLILRRAWDAVRIVGALGGLAIFIFRLLTYA